MNKALKDTLARVDVKTSGYPDRVAWQITAEDYLVLVMEARRRFLELVQDERQATALTLAWASIYGGYESCSDV